MVIALALGCRPEPPSPVGHSAAILEPAHSGTDPDAPFLDCELQPDHALRGRCTVTWAAADGVTLTFRAPGEDARVFRDDASAPVHEVAFWGLVPDTTWTVTAVAPNTGETREVALRSGRLPSEFDRLWVDVVDGGDSHLSSVVLTPSCPALHVVAVDRRGRVVHYENTQPDVFLGDTSAFSLTDRDTFLVTMGKSRIREYGFDGSLVRELVRGRDFEPVVHHDVIGRGGWTFSLAARTVRAAGRDWVVDSVLAFDPGGVMAAELDVAGLFPYEETYWMREGYWAGQFPGAVDLTHANAVSRDAAGDLWVSFRHQFAFARFSGEPTEPSFGALEQLVVGDDESPAVGLATADVTGGPLAPFTGQHDVHRGEGDSLLLFDNGYERGRVAEASRYRWDEATATLTWQEGWPVGRSCPTMGAARELPGGHVLATCASQGLLREFAPGRVEPVWEAELRCSGQPSIFAEGVPLRLPTE